MLAKPGQSSGELQPLPHKYSFLHMGCNWTVHANTLSNTELELWIRIMLFVQKIENEIVPRTAAITQHIILEGFGVI